MSESTTLIESAENLSSSARYYHLHRVERITKKLEVYHSRPDVIAKRAERERIKAEKEAQKAADKAERAKKVEEKRLIALKTRRKGQPIPKEAGGLAPFLGGDGTPPAEEK
jgi:hypothetical protein